MQTKNAISFDLTKNDSLSLVKTETSGYLNALNTLSIHSQSKKVTEKGGVGQEKSNYCSKKSRHITNQGVTLFFFRISESESDIALSYDMPLFC